MSLIKISESEDWIVDYDRERGMYRVSYFENNHFVDECWFDCYEEKEVRLPSCSVGDVVWYTHYRKEPMKCRVSMLQQKSDKSWKVRLTPPNSGVFDITLDEFNEFCFFTQKEAEENIGT
jgi:hypothetical protein